MKQHFALANRHTTNAAASRSVLWRLGRIIIWLFGIGILIVVTAISAALIYSWYRHNQTVILPQPTGPYAVGRLSYDWTDQSRPETFDSHPGAKRELMVWIWYPADARTSGEPVKYLPANWRRATKRGNGIDLVLSYFLTQNLAQVKPHALADVPPASTQEKYPVLVMQPGLGPIATDYTTIAEELASHGYIVVASTPTYSAKVVVFDDGRVVEGSRAANIEDDATPAEAKSVLNHLIPVWVTDNQFVLDQLETLNRSDASQRFSGRLDMARIGLFGHSFGGASAAQTCSIDTRCVAGADLDGYLYGDVVQQGIQQPFLFIWSEPNADDPNWQTATSDVAAVYERTPNDVYQVTIRGAQHFNFTDMVLMYSPVLRLMHVVGPIDSRRGLQIATAYLEAFFNRYLQDTESPLLAGPSNAYREVEFRSR